MNYTPNRLLNQVAEHLKAINDKQLAVMLYLDKSTVCNLRNQRTSLTATHVLRIHEITGWTVKRIRQLAGDDSTQPYQALRGQDGKNTSVSKST